MNKFFGICLFLQFLSFFVAAQSGVSNLLVENLKNPVGLDVRQPRFSWQLANDRRNIRQLAYEIKVLDGKSVLWNSGRVEGKTSVHVPYGGAELKSGKAYGWQVRVWDNSGKPSAWSAPSNTRATVYIPSKSVDDVKENGGSLSASKDIQVKGMEEGYVVVELGSGKYFFTTAR